MNWTIQKQINLIGIGLFTYPLTSVILQSCQSNGGRAGIGEKGGDSIVAVIGGISDEDIQKNPVYRLLCKDPDKKDRGPLTGNLKDQTKIIFNDAAAVQPNDTCAFEVTLPNATDPKFKDLEWFAFNGTEKMVGLMYGSDFAKVTNDRRLALKVLKVYSDPFASQFKSLIKVTLPQDDRETLSASLFCDGNLSTAGTVLNTGETGSNRTIELSLNEKFFNKKCSELSLLSGSVAKYSLKGISDLDFTGAKAKDILEFPKNFKTDGKRYTLGMASNNPLIPEFKDGGACTKYDSVTKVCLDPPNRSSSARGALNVETYCVGGKSTKVYVTYGGNGRSGEIPSCDATVSCDGPVLRLKTKTGSADTTIPLDTASMCDLVQQEVDKVLKRTLKPVDSTVKTPDALNVQAFCEDGKAFKVIIAYGLNWKSAEVPSCAPAVRCEGDILNLSSSSASSTIPLDTTDRCNEARAAVQKTLDFLKGN